ncbi:hypothetical protein [Mycobacterium kyorinense]|uniref:DedA family protein n=1 Tax=Mycobacterium kyorinense TaxID=487514 RepID=A0A1X1YC04_9MYCO|nr:hypothetical protein [Mycobacterium kyorinense]ORW08595.1 hypothetical protein AWC14_22905 [Mycobacterium kyorinense]
MQQFTASYRLVAIFVLMAAESACIPIPSELIIMLFGLATGRLEPGVHPILFLIIVAGVAGKVVGS